MWCGLGLLKCSNIAGITNIPIMGVLYYSGMVIVLCGARLWGNVNTLNWSGHIIFSKRHYIP